MASIAGKKVLFIIAPSDFRDEELFDTKEELEKYGVDCLIASRETGTAIGVMGGNADVQLTLDQFNGPEFDAVIFVGGSGASEYFDDPKAQSIARKTLEAGKIVAAICIAPSILANAGILKGRNATAFKSEAANLKEKGAKYTGQPVSKDGMVITANGPDAAREFGKEIAKALTESA